MNIRRYLLCLYLAVSAALVFSEEFVHVVRQGETIYSIARTYGVNYLDVLTLNDIEDARRLVAGQRIRIPQKDLAPSPSAALPTAPAPSPAVQPRSVIEHRVAPGETLFGISRLYGLSVAEIRSANGLSESYMLKIGDRLRIPVTQAVPSPQAAPARPAAPLPAAPAPARTAAPARPDTSVYWPVGAKELSYMTGKLSGVVLLGERSESVKSLTGGTVVYAGPYRGFGRVAIVQRTGGYQYVYAGCESLSVNTGDQVVRGTELGRLGVDAVSGKPELVFLVSRNNSPMDPAKAPRD